MLRNWDYDPSSISARWIQGRDGKLRVQLRLDLGLFQMNVDGRPDGTRPHGHTSLVDYYLAREKDAGSESIALDSESCGELQQEAMQYYYRYLSFYALHHFDGVITDTEHNLALLAFVARRTEDDDLAWQFMQFYPYVRMMNARARAEKAVEAKKYEEAIAALQDALKDIQAFWDEYGEGDSTEATQEVELLTDLLNQVSKRKPKTHVDKLREQMAQAISMENYEKAAMIRDKLRDLQRQISVNVDKSKK